MKMPENQSSESGLFEYEETSYFSATLESNEMEEFSTPENDFSEYLWMENEEEFDKEVLQRLEEEALMEQCIEAMLADETRDTNTNSTNHQSNVSESGAEVTSMMNNMKLDSSEVAKESNLNPLAAEFVPNFLPSKETVTSSS